MPGLEISVMGYGWFTIGSVNLPILLDLFHFLKFKWLLLTLLAKSEEKVGQLLNWLNELTAYAMSGLVTTAKYIKDQIKSTSAMKALNRNARRNPSSVLESLI